MNPLALMRSLWSRLFNRATSAQQEQYNAGGRRAINVSGVYVDEGNALTLATVWCAVRAICEPLAAMPYHVYMSEGRKNTIARNHPVDWLLSMQPNPEMTAFDFWDVMAQRMVMKGNGIAEIERNNRGEPAWLWPIETERTQLKRNAAGGLQYEFTNQNREVTILDPADVYHLHGLGDGLWGYSVIGMARESIGMGLAMEQFGSAFFGGGAHPGATIEAPVGMVLPKNAVDALVAEFDQRHAGAKNAFKTTYLDKGMKVSYPTGISNDDSQFLECVVPETAITMADRTRRRADEIKVNDLVVGWDGQRLVPSRITAVADNGAHPVVKIKTHRGRELISTLNHPCLASRKVRCDKCSRNHAHTSSGLVAEWINAGDLRAGDYISAQRRIDWPGSGELSFDDGYFIGAMVGDGSIRAKHTMGFTQQSTEVAEAVGAIANARFCARMTARDHYQYDIVGVGKIGRPKVGEFNPLRKFFTDLGLLGCLAHEKFIPENVFRSGPEAVAGFLSGYLDTDGTVASEKKPQPYVTWTSVSERLARDTQHALSLMGVQASLREQAVTGCRLRYEIIVCGRANVEDLAKIVRSRHPRRAPRLAYWSAKIGKRERADFQHFDRIISVEQLPARQTILLEVEGTHSHVTNGLITHNSRQFNVLDIARWFRVPPHLLYDLSRATFSNIEFQALDYVVHTLLPWARRIERQTDVKLFGRQQRGVFYSRMNFAGMLRGDIASRFAAYAQARQNGWMSANDIRELEDQNPVAGGDEYLVQVNMTPADLLREQAEANIKKTNAPPPPVAAPTPQPGDDVPAARLQRAFLAVEGIAERARS